MPSSFDPYEYVRIGEERRVEYSRKKICLSVTLLCMMIPYCYNYIPFPSIRSRQVWLLTFADSHEEPS